MELELSQLFLHLGTECKSGSNQTHLCGQGNLYNGARIESVISSPGDRMQIVTLKLHIDTGIPLGTKGFLGLLETKADRTFPYWAFYLFIQA